MAGRAWKMRASSSAERGCANRPHIFPGRAGGSGLGGRALLAHGGVGDRWLRRAGGAWQGPAADRLLRITLQMHLGELAIWQAPGHVASFVRRGRRCHLDPWRTEPRGSRRGTPIVPENGLRQAMTGVEADAPGAASCPHDAHRHPDRRRRRARAQLHHQERRLSRMGDRLGDDRHPTRVERADPPGSAGALPTPSSLPRSVARRRERSTGVAERSSIPRAPTRPG